MYGHTKSYWHKWSLNQGKRFDPQLGYEVIIRGITLSQNGLIQWKKISWVPNKVLDTSS